VFAVVVFHRIYESVELGNASFDHQPPSKLVAPSVTFPLYGPLDRSVKRGCGLQLFGLITDSREG
jgi:hypothetical protein